MESETQNVWRDKRRRATGSIRHPTQSHAPSINPLPARPPTLTAPTPALAHLALRARCAARARSRKRLKEPRMVHPLDIHQQLIHDPELRVPGVRGHVHDGRQWLDFPP